MEDSVNNDLSMLVGYYESFENNTVLYRQDSETNRDYYDNKQITSEEEEILKARKQPVIVFNLYKRTIDALLGFEQTNRTDPKALPRTPQHQEDAESCTDAIRYVLDNNDFDTIASDAFGFLLLEGVEAADVQVQLKSDHYEVTIYCVPWDRLFWDIHSRKKDFSDAKFKGIVIWMDYEDAKQQGEAQGWDLSVLEMAKNATDSYSSETHDDKPIRWNDTERKRLRVCLINYRKNGVWHYAYFTKLGILKADKSGYLDENGEPDDFFEFQSAFVSRDGDRYAYAKALRDPQDEVNKRRSKALHLLNVRQTFGNQTTGIDAHEIKAELAKPDGHVEMKHGEFGKDFGIIPNSDMSSGNLQLLEEAKDIFNVVGANTSITGTEDRVMSGRAEIVRQQAGIRELTPVMSAHRAWKKRIYRKVWNRIRQFWKEEKWIRVTDDEKNLKWVGLNQPITQYQVLEEKYQGNPEMLQLLQQQANDPRMAQVLGVKNDLAELDVDILIEEAPDVATIQDEQFQMVSALAESRPEVPIEAVVELSQLRNKEAFLEKIKGDEETQRMQAARMQEAEEIAKQEKVVEMENMQADTLGKRAKAFKDHTDAEAQQLENSVVQRMVVANG